MDSKSFSEYIKDVHDLPLTEWELSERFYLHNREKREQIAEKKRSRRRIGKDDIAAATQFFTPDWLAKYLSDNSLGRLSQLAESQYKDFAAETSMAADIDGISVLDPAVGSGNMLLAAYETLEAAHLAAGTEKADIPQRVLSRLYGLDIDERAVAIAKTLLLKKSGLTHFDFSIFTFKRPSEGLIAFAEKNRHFELKKVLLLLQNNPEIGSMLKCSEAVKKQADAALPFFDESDGECLNAILLLCQKYSAILMNPPYLAASDYPSEIRKYIFEEYPCYKQDMFAVFIAKSINLLEENGFLGVVCPYNWMFLKTFCGLRKTVLERTEIKNLVQLSHGGYKDAVVYISAFVLKKADNTADSFGKYTRLTDFKGKEQRERLLVSAGNDLAYTFFVPQSRFQRTPQNAIIYWGGKKLEAAFSHPPLQNYLEIRQGIATGDNKYFLRKIEDVFDEVSFDSKSLEDFDRSGKKYVPYNKGGPYRKWFGNRTYCILFTKEARAKLQKSGNCLPSKPFYFKECITWTLVSSKASFGARYSNNSLFDVGGSCGFIKENSPVSLYVILGYLCSTVASYFLNALNPTLNMQVGDMKRLPFALPTEKMCREIEKLVKQNIEIAQKDWYNGSSEEDILTVKENEEQINMLFIDLYGLKGEVGCDVPFELITLRKNTACVTKIKY